MEAFEVFFAVDPYDGALLRRCCEKVKVKALFVTLGECESKKLKLRSSDWYIKSCEIDAVYFQRKYEFSLLSKDFRGCLCW